MRKGSMPPGTKGKKSQGAPGFEPGPLKLQSTAVPLSHIPPNVVASCKTSFMIYDLSSCALVVLSAGDYPSCSPAHKR